MRTWQKLLKRFGREWPEETLAGRPEPGLLRSEHQLSSRSPGQTCELWLCGCAFTLADVLLGATLHRLKFLGLSKKYWEDGSRPNLQSFFERVQRRFAFRKVLGDIHTTLLSAVIPNAFRLVKRKPPSFFGASFLMGSLGGMGYFAYWYLKKKYI